MDPISAAPLDINSVISMLIRPIDPAPAPWNPNATRVNGKGSQSGQTLDNQLRLIDLDYTGGNADGTGLLQHLSLKALIGPAWAFAGLFSNPDDPYATGYDNVPMTDNVDPSLYQVQPTNRDLAAGRAAARQAYASSRAAQIGTLISGIG